MTCLPTNRVLHGDCVQVMRGFPAESVDFVLTDPPYLSRYRARDGRTMLNDDNTDWLRPAYAEMFRLLKPRSLAVSFYGWHRVDVFFDAMKAAGFKSVGHIVFIKRYTSSKRFLACRHGAAYLLAKGDAPKPAAPIPDVMDWHYTGNRLHPTENSPKSLTPLVQAFCKQGGVVLDPFCGAGSSLLAARDAGCSYLGIELDEGHHSTASKRLGCADAQAKSAIRVKPSRRAGAYGEWAQPFSQYAVAA